MYKDVEDSDLIIGSATPPRRTRLHIKTGIFVIGILGILCVFALVSRQYSAEDENSTTMSLSLRHKKPPPSICESPSYTHTTIKTAFEGAISSFFLNLEDPKGIKPKHEMSDVIYYDSKFYAIADSSWDLYEVDETLPRFSAKNSIIEPAVEKEEGSESSYEAIFEDDGVFYVVRESIPFMKDGLEEWHAVVVELTIDAESKKYNVIRECQVEPVFEGDSKGFEGAIHLHAPDGTLYMLALCEGNHCAEGLKGKEKGNGILLVTKRDILEDGSCIWSMVRRMSIPSSAYFADYSGINVDRSNGNVIISSQEESQLWIGRMDLDAEGFWDPDPLSVGELRGGLVYNFPRNDNCDVVYCNLEGVTWVSGSIIVAVSDQMKAKGKQNFRCLTKDQSIHLFSLPNGWEEDLEAVLAPSA